MKLSLSILNADFSSLLSHIEGLLDLVDYVHFDVMDGHFVPNLTFGPPFVNSLRGKLHLPFDIHLMIDRPSFYVPRFTVRPTDVITFHLEALDSPAETIETIRKLGCKVGISLRPRTPISTIFPFLDEIDWILVMSVEPGFGGQEFLPQTLERLRALREKIGDRAISVAVDGGIGPHNVRAVLEAGADVVVVGAAIFRAANPREAALNLWKAAGHPKS